MNNTQEAKLNMYNAVAGYCDQSTAATASLPAFAPALLTFKDGVSAIDAMALLEANVITGIAINKADLKNLLCVSGAILAAALFAFATAEEDPILQQKVKYSFSDLMRLKDDELGIITQNLHNDAVPIVGDLLSYGVTLATLEDFQDSIEDYNETVAAPRIAVAVRKTYVAQLKTLFKQSDVFLKTQLDKLADQFKLTNPEFYTTYKNSRKIVNAPTSTTQAKGIIIDSVSGLPVFDVVVAVEDQEYSATSNLEGGYTVKIPQPGVYTLSFVKEGYQPLQAPNIEIVLGQATVIDMQLIPAA